MQQPDSLIGQVLGHYRIIKQIGYGGMATVFLAEDVNLGREVAVKVFWPRPGETRDFLKRFEREARVLAKLDHPNILPVFDYGEQNGFAYLITPYLPGGSLKEMLQKRKVIPPVEALRMAAPVLNALQYANERGLIHRDIKPGNMLFKGDGSPVLADFGLVKVFAAEGENVATHSASETGPAVTGTPEYMSPEQIQGRPTPVSDIYSFGIVLYEMQRAAAPAARIEPVYLTAIRRSSAARSGKGPGPSLSTPARILASPDSGGFARHGDQSRTERANSGDKLARATSHQLIR